MNDLEVIETPVSEEIPFVRADADYRHRLGISIFVSLLANLLFLWGLAGGVFTNVLWKSNVRQPKRSREPPRIVLVERVKKPEQMESSRSKTFLETDSSQASSTPPPDSAFYSEHNTLAAQPHPSPVKSIEIPKAEGQNVKTFATESVDPSRRVPSPASSLSEQSPSPPRRAQESPPPSAETLNEPSQKPLKRGEYAWLKQSPPAMKSDSVTDRGRDSGTPSTGGEGLQQSGTPSSREVMASKSKLEGGVPRKGALAFNSSQSPFAAYDKKVVEKIGAYWRYQVADRFYGETAGEVEIEFKLMADGSIQDIRVARNTANVVLAGWCIQAIQKSTPFIPFPENIRLIAGESRDASVTFHY